MSWLPRLAAGAAVALAGAVALMLAQDGDRAAVTSISPVDGATLAQAPTEVDLAFTGPVDPNRSHIPGGVGSGDAAGLPAPASGHQHDIDPVSAGLLLADAITVLAVVLLLLRRPRRSAPGRS